MAVGYRVIVLTRDASGNRRWAAALKQHGWPVLSAPMIKTTPTQLTPEITSTLHNLTPFDWLIVTSGKAAAALKTLAQAAGADLSAAPRVAAVGPAGAVAAKRNGLTVAFVAKPATAAMLAEQLIPVAGQRILVARTDIPADEPAATLRARGAVVTEINVYHTLPRRERSAKLERYLLEGRVQCLIFASPSAVTGLIHTINSALLITVRHQPVFTIGPTTTAAARAYGFQHIVQAVEPTIQSIMTAVDDLKTSHNLASDEHWPIMPVVTVPGDTAAGAMPLGATQLQGERVVQSWQRIAVLEVTPAQGAYVGFMAGDHLQFMNVPVELKYGRFGVRVGDGNVKFFVIPVDLHTRLELKLVAVARMDDPQFEGLPLY